MTSQINLLRKSALCLLAIAVGSSAEGAANAIRPNIVLVVSDDQGYGDASCYWNTDLQTPVMDAVARRGVRFTQFRVNPLCAPTRASLMTGLYSLEAGMWRGPGRLERGPKPEGGWPKDARRIRDEVLLLPQYLKKAGYATGIFGKWHLGYDPNNVPNARGFDEFVGFLGGAHPYWRATPPSSSATVSRLRPTSTRRTYSRMKRFNLSTRTRLGPSSVTSPLTLSMVPCETPSDPAIPARRSGWQGMRRMALPNRVATTVR